MQNTTLTPAHIMARSTVLPILRMVISGISSIVKASGLIPMLAEKLLAISAEKIHGTSAA